MRRLRAPIRRFLPLLIGSVILSAASGAFAQNGALNQIVTQYNQATTQWMGQLLNYATNLFAALAAIEFAWTAIILAMEQRELEGWVAAFIKKLMGISFFYALLLKGPDWIKAIIDSFTQIGQNVGGTGALTADGILQLGVQLGQQIISAALGLLNPGPLGIFNLANVFQNFPLSLLLGAIAVVLVLCFVAIAFQFIMAQVEGFIVISAGMIYLGFGGSRWTSSYVERFLGTAVSTGIRIMVFYLIIGLGETLAQGAWSTGAQTVVSDVNGVQLLQAASDGFVLAASVLIFTVLAFRLPKVVGSVISGSPSLSAGDLAGTVGTLVGGAAAVAQGAAMLAVAPEAAPELLAARAGSAAAEGAMSAGKAADAGAGSLKGMSGGNPMGFAGKSGSGEAQPPAGSSNKNASNGSGAPGSNRSNQAQPPGASPGKAASSAPSSNVSGTPGSNAKSQAQPPSASASASASPSRGTVGNGASVGSSRVGAQAPSTFSPSSGGVSSGTGGGTDAAPPAASASADGAASFTASPSPAPVPESIGSPISAGAAAPPPATYDSPFASAPPSGKPEASPLQNLAQGARKVSDVLHQVQGGLHSLENDGGGTPVSVPPPTEGSLRD